MVNTPSCFGRKTMNFQQATVTTGQGTPEQTGVKVGIGQAGYQPQEVMCLSEKTRNPFFLFYPDSYR